MDFEKARSQMIETQLRANNVVDKRLLSVVGRIARENFVPKDRVLLAYTDASHDLNLPNGRTLPSIMPIARLIQLANIEPTDVVLDIACGSGYSTALIAGLSCAVVGVEDDESAVTLANTAINVQEIGNAAILYGALSNGLPSEGPFDVIVIEGIIDRVPAELFDQLAEKGRLVSYLRKGNGGVATVFVKSEGQVTARQEFNGTLPELDSFNLKDEFLL